MHSLELEAKLFTNVVVVTDAKASTMSGYSLVQQEFYLAS